MSQQNKGCKVQIRYPCVWLYKVIGSNREKLYRALQEITDVEVSSITFSKSSSTGRYHCLNLEVTVMNEEERNNIYRSLKNHPLVKIVL